MNWGWCFVILGVGLVIAFSIYFTVKTCKSNDKATIDNFGMDYAVPGSLGGLGQGYVQPSLL